MDNEQLATEKGMLRELGQGIAGNAIRIAVTIVSVVVLWHFGRHWIGDLIQTFEAIGVLINEPASSDRMLGLKARWTGILLEAGIALAALTVALVLAVESVAGVAVSVTERVKGSAPPTKHN